MHFNNVVCKVLWVSSAYLKIWLLFSCLIIIRVVWWGSSRLCCVGGLSATNRAGGGGLFTAKLELAKMVRQWQQEEAMVTVAA